MFAPKTEFSFRTRLKNIERLKNEEFDILIIGGGITGVGVAWDAVSRGLKVALIEKNDFASGTSSKSSKLIHGGLRYLENKEFGLVFEALSERAYLMKSCPNLVQPLPFYMPIYKKGAHPASLISAGMWLYDTLSLFRTPKMHTRLNQKETKKEIPVLNVDNVVATFRYYDASMWDHALGVEVAHLANEGKTGVGKPAIATRIEAQKPIWNSDRIQGYELQDGISGEKFNVRFKKLIVCTGAWSDEIGRQLSPGKWNPWIAPSRGVHLVFDWKRIPIPGAVVMEHPKDGRISFVIPRKDFGPGVTMVGTTDGPTHQGPDRIDDDAEAIGEDTKYLMDMLLKYFPDQKLTEADIVAKTIGVRPLVDPAKDAHKGTGPASLQKVSREHTIEEVTGHAVMVAGGKYTTFRKMAEEIVDYALKDSVIKAGPAATNVPICPNAQPDAMKSARSFAAAKGWKIPEELFQRYGSDAIEIYKIHLEECNATKDIADPDGFPCLEAQFRFAIRYQMVLSVQDFFERRLPVTFCRKDKGAPWIPALEKVWKELSSAKLMA